MIKLFNKVRNIFRMRGYVKKLKRIDNRYHYLYDHSKRESERLFENIIGALAQELEAEEKNKKNV